jgi:hypothetical protein
MDNNQKMPWWVMLFALAGIGALDLFGVKLLPNVPATVLDALGAGAAGFLGLHTEAPPWLVKRPIYATLMHLVGWGAIAKVSAMLALLPSGSPMQSYLWMGLTVLCWLAGKQVPVTKTGQAVPPDSGQ